MHALTALSRCSATDRRSYDLYKFWAKSAGPAAASPGPVAAISLERGERKTYKTVAGDDVGIIAHTRFNGTHPLSLVFGNKAVLDAAGWRLGQPIPAGIKLN